MSNAGQAVLTVVGTVVGSYFGYPQLGYLLGSLAGQALFPTQLPGVQGPRLADGQQTTSAIGAGIPWIHGTQPSGGCIIWASPIREVAETQTAGGKGGPEQEQTTYRYYRSFAILIGEGPIAGIRTIKANGKYRYDRRNRRGIPPDQLGEDLEFRGRQVISNHWATKLTIYLGTEDQMPDPTIESFEGVGNVPAYRGYAYVVFNDVELKAEDGFRIPTQWKFEVYEEGDTETSDADYYAQEVLYDWTGNLDPRDPRNRHEYLMTVFPNTYTRDQDPGDPDPIPELLELAYSATSLDRRVLFSQRTPLEENGIIDDIWHLGGRSPTQSQDAPQLRFHFNTSSPPLYFEPIDTEPQCVNMLPPGSYYYGRRAPLQIAYGSLAWVSGQTGGSSDPMIPGWFARVICDFNVYYTPDLQIEVHRKPAPPPSPCSVGRSLPDVSACVYGGALFPVDGVWELDDSQNYHVLQKFEPAYPNQGGIRYPLGPALPVGHPDDTEEFWTAAYNAARARGARIAAGLQYGVDYPKTQSYGYKLSIRFTWVETFPVSLATIVSRICDRVAERVGNFRYDVSDLEEIYIIGAQFSRPMPARQMIEPLRSIGFFDVIEDGIQLKFVTRGKAPVATLTEDDLGARFFEEDPVSKITTKMVQELELPRQIRVHFQNPERDYDPGEESSPARFDTKAESVIDIELPVALTPTHAARIAETLYRDIWGSRFSHRAQLDIAYSGLQPGDVLVVPIDGQSQRVRITASTERLPSVRVLELLRDDDGSYVSTAAGHSRLTYPEDEMILLGPVEFVLLDLPPLAATHNDAGVYVAVRPLIEGGAFRGANIASSQDGSTYTVVASLSEPQIMGTVIDPLAQPATATVFDDANSIFVELDSQSDELENATDEEMLEGANLCAVGVHGRWELVQFGKAVQEMPGFWRLSRLLRGRRGTEHLMGTGAAGDRFVLLRDVARIPLQVADISAPRFYIGTPTGTAVASDEVQEFATTGEALRPFSPVHIQGTRDSSGNLTITFTRRDRLATDIDEAMSEEYEDYEIDILDEDGEVRRTISTSTTSVTYTAEQQTADFGEPQEPVSVAVYQMSVAVGRGAPGWATL